MSTVIDIRARVRGASVSTLFTGELGLGRPLPEVSLASRKPVCRVRNDVLGEMEMIGNAGDRRWGLKENSAKVRPFGPLSLAVSM